MQITDDEDVRPICDKNGRMEERDQQFFNNVIRALEKRGTKCISVTKYDIRIFSLSVSLYELFERPTYFYHLLRLERRLHPFTIKLFESFCYKYISD